ncbi:hypothetical protein BCS71_25720 [Vibrio lentus]|uniref:hypothetical protein n=1 Tax=Vibrio lentus TaxID=136468 RepID=UPI000C8305E0|nr:hypothetical protein [Vibrio lentus]PMI58288.1 hypothetical protein BCU41_03910 [Vibrio lentus]
MFERREDVIIITATRNWLQNSNHSQAEFATEMLAPNVKSQEPQGDEVSYTKWRQNITQRVSCIMTGKQPFPLTWKWAWIEALPDEVRKVVESDIASLSGYLHVMPTLEGADTVEANTAKIYHDFSHLVKNSESSHDGVYDESDDLSVANVQADATLDLIETLIDELKRLHLGTGATGRVRHINQLNDMLGGLCPKNSKEK